MPAQIKIGERAIGAGQPVYIIAEVSANHHQNFEEALKIIRAAKDAGVDAVKLQTYTADTITIPCDREEFRVSGGTIWDGRNLHQLYGEAHTPWDWQPKLKHAANDLGLDLFSSPFDATAVDFLEEMNVPAHKLASFELVDIPLIQKMASTGKPLIMSTGMASLEEIEEAVQTARNAGADAARAELSSFAPAELDEEERTDASILANELDGTRFEIAEERDAEMEPRFYANLIGDGLDPLVTRDFAPLETRMKSLEGRLRGIPAIVAVAKKRLGHPARVNTETAIEQTKGLIDLCEHDLPALFAKVPPQQAALEAARQPALLDPEGPDHALRSSQDLQVQPVRPD